MSVVKAAQLFSVHHQTIYNWIQLRTTTQTLAPRSVSKNGPAPRASQETIRKTFEDHPSLTLKEASKILPVCFTSISRALKQMPFQRKKTGPLF